LIVAEYLDEQYPGEGKLRLEDPFAHAQEKLAIETYSKIIPIYYKLLKDDEFEANHAKFNELLNKFLEYLKDDFLGGKTASYADYMVWPWTERFEYLQKFRSVKFDESFAEKLNAYVDRMLQLPAVKECYQVPALHAKFYEGYVVDKINWDSHLD
jgi:glutathione S-transferase